MHCELRTPEKTLFAGEARMIVARSPWGEFGVMDGHAPLLAALRPSRLRIKTGDGEITFAVANGLMRVGKDEVSILAQNAVRRDAIDVASVRARIENASAEELAFLRVQEQLRGTDG